MELYEQFKKSYTKLITPEDNVLVAVSGGIDSMTLLHLLHSIHPTTRLAVAHCNFGLRGAEADTETTLVENTCRQMGITWHIERMDTYQICNETGESIQIAARRLRYDFFNRLCNTHLYTKIAVAHNQDDTIETFFINLIRGTGLRGLRGIPLINQRIVRPLMFAPRTQIETYASQNNVPFLLDSSNNEDHYLRNKLRHNILPLFKEISPNFSVTMGDNITRLDSHNNFEQSIIATIRHQLLVGDNLDIPAFREHHACGEFLLHALAEPYGFSWSVAQDIYKCLTDQKAATGKRFYSETHMALIDREQLIFSPLCDSTHINEELILADDPRVKIIATDQITNYKTAPNVALFDADKLLFPLILRRWHEGDRFIPFGMSGSKKVSDLLVDSKFSMIQKRSVRVLQSGDDLAWVIGLRTDDRYRITHHTLRIAQITLD